MEQRPNRLPRAALLLASALFAIAALSGLGGMAAAAFPLPKPAWTLFGFEFVVAGSATIGFFFCRTRDPVEPAMGLGWLAGCIAAASGLGFLSAQEIGGVSTLPFAFARTGLALAIGAIALLAALGRDRRRWTTLFKGVAAGIPVVIAVGLLVLPAGQRLLDRLGSVGGVLAFIIGTGVFLVLTALAAASAHLVIASFRSPGISGLPASPPNGK